MTILVTGGAGFIGANFVYYLLKEHPAERVVCVDCLTYAGNLSTLDAACEQPNFVFYKENICNRPAIFEIFEQEHPDIVVNFAAESHVDRSIESPEVFLQTNILGTQVMMDACRQYGVQRYHQVSTDEVYGDLPLDRPDLLLRKNPHTCLQPLQCLQSIGRFTGWGLLPHILPPCNYFALLQQLWSISVP